jgi:Secretion system C-terminal sorting domain
MTHFNKISRFLAAFLFASCLGMIIFSDISRAASFTYSPDTLTFTPTNQDSVIEYVRIAYSGDTTGPGTYIHARVYDGSSYFSCSTDTVFTRSYFYLRVAYKPQSSMVFGELLISDDSVTHYVTLIGNEYTPEDGVLSGYGPYFPTNTPEGKDTCTTMRLINTGSDLDTIVSAGWSHDPNGIFTWDSVSVPTILAAGDTTFWTFCFHAPDNTTLNIDTFVIHYHDAQSQTRIASRIVEGTAIVPSDGELQSEGPYFPASVPEGKDTCTTLRLINSGTDVDTIETMTWSHDPNGIFTWDSASLPLTLGAHDTLFWTYCFHAPNDTNLYYDSIMVQYHDASSQTRYIVRIVEAKATDTTPPDAPLDLYDGPYFPTVLDEGKDTCATMRVINSGDDLDTIVSVSWTHNPNGIFTWDSVSLPATIGSHDTDNWTFCFHAPNDTNEYIDTFVVIYHDASGSDRHVSRIIEAKATNPNIVMCYTLYATTFATTNVGDTSYIHLYIRNNLSDSSTLTGVHISGSGDGAFRVDSSNFPTTIAPNSYDSVVLMFIPNRTSSSDNDEYTATLTGSFTTEDTDECNAATVSLGGYMPQSCSDTATVTLDTIGTDDVDVSGDSASSYAHRIDVVNNTNGTIVVSAVRFIDSTTHFYIYQIVPGLPDTLAPGAGMAVIIHFFGDTGQVYYDTLALTIGNGITSGGKYTPLSTPGTMYISVKGIQTAAAASVESVTASSGLNLMLYPNPSSGIVNMQLDGATNAIFEVFDVLGNVITSHTGEGTWQWDATASGLVNGTYFIRASSGELVATKRLVIQK